MNLKRLHSVFDGPHCTFDCSGNHDDHMVKKVDEWDDYVGTYRKDLNSYGLTTVEKWECIYCDLSLIKPLTEES